MYLHVDDSELPEHFCKRLVLQNKGELTMSTTTSISNRYRVVLGLEFAGCIGEMDSITEKKCGSTDFGCLVLSW